MDTLISMECINHMFISPRLPPEVVTNRRCQPPTGGSAQCGVYSQCQSNGTSRSAELKEPCQEKHSGNNGVEGGGVEGGGFGCTGGAALRGIRSRNRAGRAEVNKSFTGRHARIHKHTHTHAKTRTRSQWHTTHGGLRVLQAVIHYPHDCIPGPDKRSYHHHHSEASGGEVERGFKQVLQQDDPTW